ncbi:MAG: hypothetical protein WDA16_09015 [Candidatus Thermoplasmatota archaeon]
MDLYDSTGVAGMCDMSYSWDFCHAPPHVIRAFLTTDQPSAARTFTLTRYA